MKIYTSLILAPLMLILANSAQANHPNDDGRVIRAQAEYDRHTVCDTHYDRRSGYYEEPRYYHQEDRRGPNIVGAIVGGALGNTVGKGDGRRAATIVGAVIGSQYHRDRDRHRHSHYDTRYRPAPVNYCREELYISGYRVQYLFDDRLYETRLSYHPGSYVDHWSVRGFRVH